MGHKRVRAGSLLLAGAALLGAILHLTAGPPVYTAAQVQDGLLHHAQTWEGRTVLVRAVETGWFIAKLCLSPDQQSNCQSREQIFLGPVEGAKTPDLRVLGTHDPRDVSGQGLPSRSVLPARWATLPLLGPLLTALLPPRTARSTASAFPVGRSIAGTIRSAPSARSSLTPPRDGRGHLPQSLTRATTPSHRTTSA